MGEEQRTLIKRRTEYIQQLEKTAGHRLREDWHCSGKVRSRDQDRDWPICEWTARFGGSRTEIPRTIISEYVCGGWRYAKILGTHVVVKSLLQGQDIQLGFRSKQWNWYCKIVFILIYSKAIKFLFCLGTVKTTLCKRKCSRPEDDDDEENFSEIQDDEGTFSETFRIIVDLVLRDIWTLYSSCYYSVLG